MLLSNGKTSSCKSPPKKYSNKASSWKYVVLYISSISSMNMIRFSFHLSELIENVKLIHKPVSLQPRGLINKGNWCYINAVSFFFASVLPVLLMLLKQFWIDQDVSSGLFIFPWHWALDPAGPDCMSPHVSSDEVYSPFHWDSETLHIHTHDGWLVSFRLLYYPN